MNWERRLFLWATVAACLPIWLVRWFPSQDGPSHVYNSRVLLDMVLHPGSAYWTSYQFAPGLTTNLAGDALLGGLSLILPPPIPEKLVATLCVVLLAWGVHHALTAMNGRGGWLAPLALPSAAGLFLHIGSYGFLLGAACFCFACGFWFRRWGVFTIVETVAFSALLLVLLVSNVTAWLVTALILGVPALWAALRRGELVRFVAPSFFAGLPSGLLFLLYAAEVKPWEFAGPAFPRLTVAQFLTDNPIVSLAAPEVWVFVGVTMLAALVGPMVLLTKVGARHFTPYDWLAPLSAFLFLLFLAAPLDPGPIGSVRPRLWLFSGLTLLFWLGAHRFSTRDRVFLCVFGVVATAAVAASHWKSYQELQPHLKDVMAVRTIISPGRSVLGLSDFQAQQPPTMRVDPFRYAAAYLTPVPDGFWVGNLEADTGQYAISARPGFEAGRLGTLISRPPCVDLSAQPVDYVLLAGYASEDKASGCAAGTYRQLTSGYDLVYQSTGGFVRVYRRRQSSAAAPADGEHAYSTGSMPNFSL